MAKCITHYPSGGLGNQLFDYAAVRSLADLKGSSLLLDPSLFPSSEAFGGRKFLLDRFPIRARIRQSPDYAQRSSIGTRLLRRIREDLGARRVYRDRHDYRFFEKFWDIPARAILRGHFLSPRFFDSNIAAIQTDLSLEETGVLKQDDWGWFERILYAEHSVAIHIRRGDFLLPQNSWLHLPCASRYRRDAMNLVQQHCLNAQFFIFSDDPAWCEKNVAQGSKNVEVVRGREPASDDPLRDFCLMQQCRHVIMSNSAFAWWAAFLRGRKDGMTLLPGQWDTHNKTPIEEMLMPGWQALGR